MEVPFLDGARGGVADGAERGLAALFEDSAVPTLFAPREVLERIFALEPPTYLRRMPGRETFSWPVPGGGATSALVVKRFRGGETRDFWYERLSAISRRARSAGRREWENLRDLDGAGFPVPRPLLWVEEPGATTLRGARPVRTEDPGEQQRARSALVMEHVATVGSLRELLGEASRAERRRLGARLLALVATLHDRGWYHRDLYLHQIGLDAAGELVLFDLGRARSERRPRRRWFEKDLAALDSSAPANVGRRERLRFLVAYLRRRGLWSREAARGWARRIGARSERIRTHVPRHVDPESA